jgi:glycyl-tRNA synthetase beta chain
LLDTNGNNDPAQIRRAAQLAKADLLTEMVGEFPELQGTMGTYYARYDGEADEVAAACSEHYRPRFSGDALPSTPTGTIVALADKLETLTGIWGIGLAPTGEKDPFALRRHALGIVRILLEKALPLEVPQLLRIAHAQFVDLPAVHEAIGTAIPALLTFLYERLRGILRERGYPAHEIDAVLSQHPARLDEVLPRLEAVHAFAALPQASALAEANKRIGNILKKSPADMSHAEVHTSLLREPAEQALYRQLRDTVAPAVQQHLHQQNYRQALASLAQLHEPVAHFFNDVMVNAEDAQLRANRLALLSELYAQMNCVADISRLIT